jgi:hypothetical protein
VSNYVAKERRSFQRKCAQTKCKCTQIDPFWSGFHGQTLTSSWLNKCLRRNASGNCRIRSVPVRALAYLRSFALKPSSSWLPRSTGSQPNERNMDLLRSGFPSQPPALPFRSMSAGMASARGRCDPLTAWALGSSRDLFRW